MSACSCRDSSTGGDHRSIRAPPGADEIMARRDRRAFHRNARDYHKIKLIGPLGVSARRVRPKAAAMRDVKELEGRDEMLQELLDSLSIERRLAGLMRESG
ncbi:hypothetical protein WME95_20065 [Sorangium sp. So ce327]|uniref:hypothetical protein n=1 Tax=Sorangium sp. So ce327 TaxID=3133301 RepID=UPI003F632B48